MAEEQVQPLDEENPWPGLMPFTEDGRFFFRGRVAEIAELERRVRRGLLTVLFGQSGLGKTSLLQAGVSPRLREADYLPIYLRLDLTDTGVPPVAQIRAALADSFAREEIDARSPEPGETLWSYFHDEKVEFWNPRNHLVTPVLIFDQFEEIFTLGRRTPAAIERLIEELAALVQNRAPESVRRQIEADPALVQRYDFAKETYKIVFALREDYLPEFESLQRDMPSIMANRMRLTRMTGRQARDVIMSPGGRLVAEGVADNIIAFVAGTRGRKAAEAGAMVDLDDLDIEPALLSIVCRELNNKRKRAGQAQITADLVSQAQEQIVSEFYDSCLADMNPAVKQFIEDQLLTLEGYRYARPLAEALQVPGITRDAIETLVGRRVLRVEERAGTQWVELTHDLLTEVVRGQRDQHRKVRETEAQTRAERERAERAEAEAREARDSAEREAQLARDAEARARAAHRQVRRVRIALAAFVAMFAVAAGVAVYAVRLQHQAELATAQAESATEQAKLATNVARVEARNASQQRIDDENKIKRRTSELTDVSPAGSLQPRFSQASALSVLNDYDDAIREYDAILKISPRNVTALGQRGYEYLLGGKPAAAIRDLKEVLAFGPEPNAYNNLAVAEAMLGDYAAAIKDLENSSQVDHDYQEVFDDEVDPDIRRATGHVIVAAGRPAFLSAMLYEQAVVHAIAGDGQFEATLAAADQKTHSSDAYLIALDAAWLIAKVQARSQPDGMPADYGIFAAKGALWERLGRDLKQPRYNDWARFYFRRFEYEYLAHKSSKYEALHEFVARRLGPDEVEKVRASYQQFTERAKTDPKLQTAEALAQFIAEQSDREAIGSDDSGALTPEDMALQAAAAQSSENSNFAVSYAREERMLDRAIEAELKSDDPDKQNLLTKLYLERAQERINTHDPKGARGDIEQVLKLDSHISEAYRLRARIDWDPAEQRRDYERAMQEDPFSWNAVTAYADSLKSDDPARALELRERALRIDASDSWDYDAIARLRWRLGRKDGALAMLDKAIAVDPARDDLYRLHYLVERKPWTLELENEHAAIDHEECRAAQKLELAAFTSCVRLLAGYRAAADELTRTGGDVKAMTLYLRALEGFAAIRKFAADDEDLRFESEASIRGLSKLIDSRFGAAYAAKFWHRLADADGMQSYRQAMLNEERRFTATP